MLEKLSNENLAKAFGVSVDILSLISVGLALLGFVISIVALVIS